MLILPWDAASPDEWRRWLGGTTFFGQLAVNNADPAAPPIVIPTHAVLEGDRLMVHLDLANPVWPSIRANPRVLFSVVGDDAYVPTTWRAGAGVPPEDGIPTTYYAAVQFTCDSELVDDLEGKAEFLRIQLRHLQPEGDYAQVAVGEPPYGSLIPGFRAIWLPIVEVAAKFKYDDHKPVEHRERVADLLIERSGPHDAGAAAQQWRRIAERGEPAAG